MKRLGLFIAILLAIDAYPQMKQEGYVKTRAKKNIPSKYIPNAVIKADGAKNKVKSDNKGKFIVVFPNKKEGEAFSLESITKKGYELVDFDLIGQPLAFSTTVPLKVLMEPEGTMLAELEETEHYVKNRVSEKHYADFAQLEHRLKIGEISETTFFYDSILIENNFRSNMDLVASMAKKYTMYDYDTVDSITTIVYDYVASGDLTKASQLLFEQTPEYKSCLAMVKDGNLYRGGRVGGPKFSSASINAKAIDRWEVSLVKGIKAYVVIAGDGDTDLELLIYGGCQSPIELIHNNLLAHDEGECCAVSFIPPYTGKYVIAIKNNGNVFNRYTIDHGQTK